MKQRMNKQIFHCFGCGEGGNVFSFLMKMEGLAFTEAVQKLLTMKWTKAEIVTPLFSKLNVFTNDFYNIG
jgi:DNA primase